MGPGGGSKHTALHFQGMRALNVLATELVREVMGYLQGEDLPLALTNTRLLMIARSIHEDRTLCAQRKSAYLSSGALTAFVLKPSRRVVVTRFGGIHAP